MKVSASHSHAETLVLLHAYLTHTHAHTFLCCTQLMTYTTLSYAGGAASLALLALCGVAIAEDWDATAGCGSFGWKRWFDSGCVEVRRTHTLHARTNFTNFLRSS